MPVSGKLLIGAAEITTDAGFHAVNAATGELLQPRFSAAGAAEVERACELAWRAFHSFRELDPQLRARFLETIAEQHRGAGR